MPSAHILVVDDSPLVRSALSRLLESSGYQVDQAASGEEGFERCLEVTYDLVVTDVTMGALSGVQLCRLLKSDPGLGGLGVIMLTAADDAKSRFWGRNAGADEYVVKDRMKEDMLPAVTRVLEGRQSLGAVERPQARAGVLERLSNLFDALLFEMVISSEVRELVQHLGDRRTFVRSVIHLAEEVASYAYLTLRLDGPAGESVAVHAREPWPDQPDDAWLRSVGIFGMPADRLDLMRTGAKVAGNLPEVGELAAFPIRAGNEDLGELCAFGGEKRLAGSDQHTLGLIAREVGVVTKSVFLVEQTQRLADTDALTGLANRRRCAERLVHEIARATRQGSPLTVVIGDIDHFKNVNDRYGHAVGDEILRETAETLAGGLRGIDLVGRWGGEEFLMLLPNASESGARVVAERVGTKLDVARGDPDGPDRVTISLGVATYVPGETAEQLVDRADHALYKAKSRGRNRVEVARVRGKSEAPDPSKQRR